MSTRVNVIYIKGSVELLLPLLQTLIDLTDWSLRLVSNGCDADELAMLEGVRAAHPERIETQVASSDAVLSHGAVLDQLVRAEESEYFCVIDSDVFARKFTDMSALLPEPGETMRCSCLPIWQSMEDSVMGPGAQVAAGEYVTTDRGDVLGCTYAAVYRTEALRSVIDEWDASFETSTWQELPAPIRAELERHDLRRNRYDTAKVINLLLQFRGLQLAYHETPSLIHIGGLSGMTMRSRRSVRALLRPLGRRWPSLGRLAKAHDDFDVADSHFFQMVELRRSEVMGLIHSLQNGEASFEASPAWLTDVDVFMALSDVFGSTTVKLPRL